MVQCRTRGPNLEEVNKTLTLGTLWLIEVVHNAGAQSSYRGDSLPAYVHWLHKLNRWQIFSPGDNCYMSYKFTRVGGTTHLLARQINYSNRMLSGCKMSVNLQGFGNVEASEGTTGHNNYSLGPIVSIVKLK